MRSRLIIGKLCVALTGLTFCTLSLSARAQDAGVAIEPDRVSMSDERLITQALRLKEQDKLMSIERVVAAIKSPTARKLALPRPATEPMPPREIAKLAKKAVLRIGWFYLCHRCNHWHVNAADGYAITADGAAVTCHHCVVPDSKAMREGYLIAIDSDQQVLPVTAILGTDEAMDAAIISVDSNGLTPLALNDRVAPGDEVYLYSDPMRVSGYFSNGIVNRFFWKTAGEHSDPVTLEGARDYRVHVSTDWAPGSSGAPVLDACGNVIGHVAVISSLQGKPRTIAGRLTPGKKDNARDDKPDTDGQGHDEEAPPTPINMRMPGPTMITLHEAVPARAVRLLAESLDSQAQSDDK